MSFKYDPFGRRIQKSSGSGISNYLYEGDNTLEEVDPNGNVLARYTQSPSLDEPLAEVRSGTTSYYQADGLGSVTSLSSAAGALANTYTYDSFGNLANSTGTVTNWLRYTGREFDTETGLYFYRARYDDPATGRFTSEDPLGFGGGQQDFYTYVRNDPVLYVDPRGLTIHLNGTSQDTANYQAAIAYLLADPGLAKIIRDLQSSSTDYLIDFNNIGDDSFDPSTNTINWDAYSALSVPGGSQSPALGLGHEMAHADGNGWLTWLLAHVPWPAYDNLEERRVITGAECTAARKLGETPRRSHGGEHFTVGGPTSR